MTPLAILILSDDRPGHYHLSEGVAAALSRRRPVDVTRISIVRRRLAPGRLLAGALSSGVPPSLVLMTGYGLRPSELPPAALVISAGGDTLAANVAAARLLGASNIYCGTLRHLPPEALTLVVSSYARHAERPRHLVTLKPNGLDPDTLPRQTAPRRQKTNNAPERAGLLIGGPSGLFRYSQAEWDHLIAFLSESRDRLGTRWIVSTSRRTPDHVADNLQAVSRAPGSPIAELIDFRSAGPGTLGRLFAGVEAILATEDSSTMLSEAVCARLPVVGVAPVDHAFKDDELEYRQLMLSEGWCRSLPLASLTPDRFAAALAGVRPLAENHLDRLADALASRVPALLR